MKLKTLLLPSLLLFLDLISNGSAYRLTEESKEKLVLWQEGSLNLVELQTVNSQGILLFHWNDLKNPSELTNYNPNNYSFVYSCFPEYLPEYFQQKHLANQSFWSVLSSKSNAVGRIGNVVFFFPNLLG